MALIVPEHGLYVREQYMHVRRAAYRWPVKELLVRFLRRLCAVGYDEADLITPGNGHNQRGEEMLGADPARITTVYNGVNPADFPTFDGEPPVATIVWVAAWTRARAWSRCRARSHCRSPRRRRPG